MLLLALDVDVLRPLKTLVPEAPQAEAAVVEHVLPQPVLATARRLILALGLQEELVGLPVLFLGRVGRLRHGAPGGDRIGGLSDLGPGADRHGFDARPLGQGPGSRLGIGHHSWPQPTRPLLRRLKATAQRHVGPEGRLVYTSADRDGQNGNSGWNVLTGGSHVVQESAPSRTQMSTTHAWRFRRLRARVSLVIPW